MRDAKEQEHIREQYADAPGTGHLVERVAGERENALAYGDEGTVERTEAELAALGYQTPEARAKAAQKRKAEAGKAAAKDEGEARRQAPAGRQAAQGRQSRT